MGQGVFITGTDTDVGKTITAAWAVQHLQADYWKPVQSGLSDGTDSDTIKSLLDIPAARIHPGVYELTAPLSPHAAAEIDGVEIDMSRFSIPETAAPLVVEGAGGVLVPLTEKALIIDLMVQLGLPVLVVARAGLGTINHTLLTLNALRARKLEITGVVMSGPLNPGNRRAIETYGKVAVLAEIPHVDPPVTAKDLAHIPLPAELKRLM